MKDAWERTEPNAAHVIVDTGAVPAPPATATRRFASWLPAAIIIRFAPRSCSTLPKPRPPNGG